MERVRGIEPPCSAWEADALPLSYTREAAVRDLVRNVVRNVVRNPVGCCRGDVTQFRAR